jgi:hypothetical protein
MYRVSTRTLVVLLGVAAVVAAIASPAGARNAALNVPVVSDAALQPSDTTIGGAPVLPTTRTVEHWFGTSLNPDDGVTYGFNMVGKDPSLEETSSIPTDVIPINVVVDGQSFDGSDVVGPTLASPQFTDNDYTSTPHASVDTTNLQNGDPGFNNGGQLSSGNTNVQLEDATMRSQFNEQGTGYHVRLSPVTVHDPVTIVVPGNKGALLQSARGVVFADVNIGWWATRIQELNNSLGYVDPTHLPIYLTNEVMLFIGTNPLNCCVIGFHGAGIVPGSSPGSVHGAGNQPVQTYAWASYVTPGTFNPTFAWALQDIHALSHEIAEWGDDPFVNNTVEPWLTPTAPQYGCTNILETGDPVVGIGFSKGTNTFE